MFQNAVLALTERMLFFRYGTPSHIFPFIAIVGERGALVTRARWESTYLSHAKRKPKTEGIFMEVAITETKQESWVFRGGGPGGNYIVGKPRRVFSMRSERACFDFFDGDSREGGARGNG